MDLTGKTVLVAGGAGLIGSAISEAILERGGNVAIADLNESSQIERLHNTYTSRLIFFEGDVTKPEITDAAIQKTIEQFGVLHGAVQSAYPRSTGWGTKFEDLMPGHLAEDIQNQLGGTILFAQRVTAALRRYEGGSLVLMSSVQGAGAPKFRHYEGTSLVSPIEYSAIKAGVNAVARYLAKYLYGQNIRVNAVSPGGIMDNQPEIFLKNYRQDCVNKGMLEANDIVGAVCFLLSDDSIYVTGQNIIVDDGWSL